MLEQDSSTYVSKDYDESAEDEGTLDLSHAEDMLRETEEMMVSAGFMDLMKHIEGTYDAGYTTFKMIQELSLSFGILSSQQLLKHLDFADPEREDAASFISYAKMFLVEGNFRDSATALRKFREIAVNLREKRINDLNIMIEQLEFEIKETKGLGADVDIAKRKLDSSRSALSEGLLKASGDFIASALNILADIRDGRVAVIKEAVVFVEKMIEDAREIGADVKEAEEQLEEAKTLFENGNYSACMLATIKAEEVTTNLIKMQTNKANELQRSLDERLAAVSSAVPYSQLRSQGLETDPAGKDSNVKITCSICGRPLEYMDRYRSWFCGHCQRYVR